MHATPCGDTNQDDATNILDIVRIVHHILGNQILTSQEALTAADRNCDAQINVSDIVILVNEVLSEPPENCACVDPCADILCETPPGDVCNDGNTRTYYSDNGVCEEGECTYEYQAEECPFGCSEGACLPDPCEGIICNTPPPPSCVPIELDYPLTAGQTMSQQIHTYANDGSCSNGACTYDVISAENCTDCCYGAEINPTGDPIGGGVGYTRNVRLEDATLHLSSTAENPTEMFLDLLSNLQSGDTLFIDGDVIVDLTGEEIIYFGNNVDNVTIASDRGVNGSLGALIFTTYYDTRPLFRSSGHNLRLSGLRIQGPDPFMGDHHYTTAPDFISEGIRITHNFAEIDNCDIWGFGYAGMYFVDGALGGYVHHNFLHHTQRAGLGYSVTINMSDVLIEANRFNNGRHHIASTGKPGSSYEARYNIILENANSHHFDMHGARDYEKYDQLALYRFDNDSLLYAEDSSIFNDHDCYLGILNPPDHISGYVNKGLAFANQYINCEESNALETEEGSISFLIKKASNTHSDMDVLFLANNSNNASWYKDFLLIRIKADGRVAVYLEVNDSYLLSLVSSLKIEDTSWHHIALTQDGNSAQIYIDGIKDTNMSGANSGAWLDQWAQNGSGIERFRMGGSGQWNDGLHGILDEVRFYSKAISAETIQRHAVGNGDSAGDFMHIHHNTFLGEHEYAYTLRGKPFIESYMHHNWLLYDNENLISRQINATGNYRVEHNFIGKSLPPNTPIHRPTSVLHTSPTFGYPPHTIELDATASNDAHFQVTDALWHTGGTLWHSGLQQQITWNTPGKVLLKSQIFNELGNYDEDFTPIEIYPSRTYALTFKILDSYRGDLAGYYEKQVFIDDEMVWSDDAAGDEGWQEVTVPLPTSINPNLTPNVELTFRIKNILGVNEEEILELFVYLDDVHFFGGQVQNGNFELTSGWNYSEFLDANYAGFISKQEKFSGHQSYEFAHGYKKASVSNGYAQIKQTIPLKSPNLRIQHSFDDQFGRSGHDESIYHHDIHPDHNQLPLSNYISDENPGFGGESLFFDEGKGPLEFVSGDALTHQIGHLHFWLKTTEDHHLQTLLKFEDSENEQALMVRLTADHQLSVARATANGYEMNLITEDPLPSNTFIHVFIQQNGSSLKIYVDGVEQNIAAGSSNAALWFDGLNIDRWFLGGNGAQYFSGWIDALYLASGTMSANEINALTQAAEPLIHFNFEDNASGNNVDSIGSGNYQCDLPGSGVVFSNGHYKEGQQSLYFDGADSSYLTCDSDNALAGATGGIAFWMKATAIIFNNHDIINLYDTGYADYLLVRIDDSEKIYVRIEDEDVGLINVYGSTSLQENQWHHVAVVQDGNGLAIYVDGVLDGIETGGIPETWTNHLDIDNHQLRIGAGHWGGFQGYLDDVRITNVPMSPGYIWELAND